MTVTRGDKHMFLKMKLRFPGDGTVQINKQEYIMDTSKSLITPNNKHSESSNDDQSKPLSDEKIERFVSVVMKLL